MHRLALLLALLAALVAAPPARADRMTFEFARLVAIDYWADRGFTVPCQAQQRLLTNQETAGWGYQVDMVADKAQCAIAVTPWAEWWRTQPDIAWYYCREIAHEVGHLAGLEHGYGGVMDPAKNVTPWGCTHHRQFSVLHGWRKPPHWVRRAPKTALRAWLRGRSGEAVRIARAARRRASKQGL